jgi:hypothetical protein
MQSTEHLRGLKRVSPCCGEPIEHPNSWFTQTYKQCLKIVCTGCGKVVHEHCLINDKGEWVYPPPKEWVDRQPPAKKRKRCRRKVPLEQEPEGLKVLY